MDNSPLLLLNCDISRVIGKYLETINNKKKTNREIQQKLHKSLLREFNIKLNHWTPLHLNHITQEELYRRPRVFNPPWIWEGKRQSAPTRNFRIINNRDGTGYFCSCMKPCHPRVCPRGGKKWGARRYPPRINHYFNYRSFLYEITD